MQISFQEFAPVRTPGIVNVASVTQLSPFRYPGGKTWLVPYILKYLSSLPHEPTHLIDPFLGGGSVPLSALHKGSVNRLVLREMDEDVSSIWYCVFGKANEELCRKILNFKISREAVVKELNTEPHDLLQRAFKTILKNRTYRGGILAKGASLMKTGENGRGVASRWYPQTLVQRIRRLGTLSRFVDFECGDGFEAIRSYSNDPKAFFFIDPPYTAGGGKRAGKRLYKHSQLDHEALFAALAACKGRFLMTYDDDPEVVRMAQRFGFHFERIPMKNTHHEQKYELAIQNNSGIVL
jgi:DNA adenine methylase